MTKLITTGFTNYFGDVVPIEILSYDNNKYVEVRKPDGSIESIKRGYIRRDAKMTRDIPEINWFVYCGGDRKNFHKRKRKTTFLVMAPDEPNHVFSKKAKSISYAIAAAKRLGQTVTVLGCRVSKGHSCYGFCSIECGSDGLAFQYGEGRRSRANTPKSVRGYRIV